MFEDNAFCFSLILSTRLTDFSNSIAYLSMAFVYECNITRKPPPQKKKKEKSERHSKLTTKRMNMSTHTRACARTHANTHTHTHKHTHTHTHIHTHTYTHTLTVRQGPGRHRLTEMCWPLPSTVATMDPGCQGHPSSDTGEWGLHQWRSPDSDASSVNNTSLQKKIQTWATNEVQRRQLRQQKYTSTEAGLEYKK